MNNSSLSLLLLLVLLTLGVVLLAPTAESSNAPPSYCLVTYDGVVYDLTSANNYVRDYVAYDIPNPKLGPNTYYIQPCMNTILNCSGLGNTPTPVCQKDWNGNYHSLGQLPTSTVLPPEFDNTTFIIEYTGGQQGRSVQIAFVCNATISTGAVLGYVTNPDYFEPLYLIYFATAAVCQGIFNGSASLQFSSPQDCSLACYQLSAQCDINCQCAHLSSVFFSPEQCPTIDGSFLTSVEMFKFEGNIASTFNFESSRDLGNALASSCMDGFTSVCASNTSVTTTTKNARSSFSPGSGLAGLVSVEFSSPYQE
eukprot:TRINITY_DN3990_c0_g1_i2.p1 TRINITY_DN3990_c0_g1~~TRINITY_DN3990_c0_g1_i2.p1  ORF type:complete len:336 (+),score=43.33 TRINITY_DN3990_c0_g1_i2:81-1010(+)